MTKVPADGRQMPLPILGKIVGARQEPVQDSKIAGTADAIAALSTWPAIEASEADKVIFEAIAANYFKAARK